MLTLEPQRLGRVHLRAVDVAGTGAPVVVHGDLPLALHVVEDRHSVVAHHGDPADLVRVEPREVHVRHLPRRKAEVAEDDVFDAVVEEGVAVCAHLARLLRDQEQEHREVVHAERPEGVLVRPERAEVLPVPVDVEDVAELSRVDDLLQLLDAGVVEQEVSRQQNEAALLGEVAELLELGAAHRRRFLDEDVLAGLERPAGELVVGRYGRGDHDALDRIVRKDVVEVGREPCARMALGKACVLLLVEVAEPDEVGEVTEVSGQVPAPLAEADLCEPRH
jgi:hypothetical protein